MVSRLRHASLPGLQSSQAHSRPVFAPAVTSRGIKISESYTYGYPMRRRGSRLLSVVHPWWYDSHSHLWWYDSRSGSMGTSHLMMPMRVTFASSITRDGI
eukprot:scaffold42284_cov49-Prasinocladus_malaysianus.AAC.1